ncbi:subunit AC19 of RNA polymerase [Tubulinosema ratisbonensis]|uniref:Subunit AC19 of RNA polymerase n=1 Tax=Tubulinosema ratisbonensis TaxID=291195 RepID=A0A437AR45_9MICR|nr:subunit AC19 of RNA polymerase [Tubulinosema ratisbonensis]
MNVNDELKEEVPRLKTVNNHQIAIGNEDHTLMNILRYTINKKCDDVDFSGYTIPHPSEKVSIFTVQYKDECKQKSENIYSTLIDGLEGIEEIGECLLNQLEYFDK